MPSSPGPWVTYEGMNGDIRVCTRAGDVVAQWLKPERPRSPGDPALIASAPDLAAQLAEAVGLLRTLHASMNHQTGPGCCPSGRFLTKVDGATGG